MGLAVLPGLGYHLSMKMRTEGRNPGDGHPVNLQMNNYNFVIKYVFGLIGILLCISLFLLGSPRKKFTLSYEDTKELRSKMLNIIAFPEGTPGVALFEEGDDKGNLILSFQPIPKFLDLLQSLMGIRSFPPIKTVVNLNRIVEDNEYASKIKDGSYTVTVTETKTTSVIKFFGGKSVKETNKYTFTLRDTKTGKIIRYLGVFIGEIKGLGTSV